MSELPQISERPPLLSVFLILLMTAAGFIVLGPLVGAFVAMPFYEGSVLDLVEKLNNPSQYPEIKTAVMVMQGCTTLIGLILLPSLYLNAVERRRASDLVKGRRLYPLMAIVVAVIVISFMAVNSVFIEWNYNFSFPEFLKGFESWARNLEDKAELLTKFFTQFNSFGEFLVGVLVIAVLPAIGEELVFRGMLQTELKRLSNNSHLAIWLSAILFSAFHMQFFGFVPRMLLGALFGYIYLWSGNLAMPMIAHFVNNGFSVLILYLNQLKIVEMDMETPEAAPMMAVIPFTLIFAGLLFYCKNFYTTKSQTV